jgi:hypothetical protein
MKEQHTAIGHQSRISALANINPGVIWGIATGTGAGVGGLFAASEQALELEPAWEQ